MSSKKPRQERSRFTFNAILQATEQLLNRQGESAFTTRKIAERAGVSIGSLYQYFTGADSILTEVLKERIQKDVEEIWAEFEASRGEKLEHRLERVFRQIFLTHLPMGRVRTFLLVRAPSLKLVEFATLQVENIAARMFAELKQLGQFRTDLDEELVLYLMSRTIFGVTMSVTIEHERMGAKSDQLARELARLIGAYVAVRA